MTLNLNRMSSYWNRDERIKINDNWYKIEESYNGVVDEVTQKAYNEIIDTVRDLTKINWLEPVPTYDDIAATYPNPTLGDITITTDDGSVYRYDGEQWVYINKIDPDVYMQLQQDFMSHLAEHLRIEIGVAPPENPNSKTFWLEDLGESIDFVLGSGLLIGNASTDGSNDVWFDENV